MNLTELQSLYFESEFNKKLKKAKFKTNIKVRLKLYKKMASLIKQGLSIKDIIEEISKVQKKNNSPEYHFLTHVSKEMQKGKSFSGSLKGWTTDNELLLIQSGEQSGDLEKSFRMAIKLTLQLKEINSTIKSQAAYPFALLILLLGVLYFFSVEIFPALTGIAPVADWPESPRTLYNLTYFVRSNILLIFAGIFAVSFVVYKSLGRLTGPVRDALDKYPPFSLYKDIQASVFLISVATLMVAQVSLQESILSLKKQSNKYIKGKMDIILGRLQKGLSGGEALNTKFMGDSGPDVEIYGKAADFEAAMLALGDEIIEDKLEKIKKVMGGFKLFMMVIFGIIIAWMFLSFFDVTSSMNNSV
jgi:type II secretory pathway component PulF